MSAPAQPLETTRAAHLAAVLGALLFPFLMTWLYFVVFAGSAWMGVLYSVGKIVQFAFPLTWRLGVQRRKLQWTPPDVRSLAIGAAFGLLAACAMQALYHLGLRGSPAMASTPQMVAQKLQEMRLSSPALFIAFAVFLSVPHALLEEYYWRWFGYGELRRVAPWPLALTISSLGFMAHHVLVLMAFLPGAPWLVMLCSVGVGVGGGMWAYIYQRYGSLYGPWLSHLLIDCGIMWIGYDLAFVQPGVAVLATLF